MSTALLLPPLKHASLCLSLFLTELNTFISLAATIPHEFLIILAVSIFTLIILMTLPLTQISFRCFIFISVSKFTRDILHSGLITHPPPNLSDLVDTWLYNSTLTYLIDIHAPLKTKPIRMKPINMFYTPALSALKTDHRHPENLWLRTHALTHLTTSNFFGLPQRNITPLILLLRNASTPLSLPPPLQTLANFGIP